MGRIMTLFQKAKPFFPRLHKPLALFAIIGLGYSLSSFPNLKSRHHSNSKTYTKQLSILSCHDGDTCKAKTSDGLTMTLRLLGIDAPEIAKKNQRNLGQPYGVEASKAINEFVAGKTLKVEIRGHDVYRRYLALIWSSSGSLINEQMILEGFAFAYRGKSEHDDVRAWSFRAEKDAQKKLKGFWKLPKHQQPQNPSDFRRRLKNKRD